ncbi:MAG: hypothetical protein ACREME_06345, partial [Gemmatimonadales bacterium]
LEPREQYGLDVLVAASRLLPVDPGSDATVQVAVAADEPAPAAFEAWLTASPPGFESHDGAVLVPRSMLRHVTALAGAGAEQRSSVRDRYGRVPAAEHLLVRAGRWREPVITRTGRALRDAVIRVADRRPIRLVAPWPGGHRWAAAFTHDVDVVAWWPLFTALRLLELARKGRIGGAAQTVIAAVRAAFRDPVGAGVTAILETEASRGVRSTWFFLCATPTLATVRAGDATYHPESAAVERIVRRVDAGGHEIGLHGSFATFEDPEAFARERQRLEALVGRPVRGVRQHFLRMEPGVTQRGMRAAGFSYDATFGFSDRGGYRLGVADAVPAWDEARGAAAPLVEVPLTWMDRALSKYQGVEDPRVWVDEALDLARTCRDVEGLWVGLWHPNLTGPLGFPGAPAEYRRLVGAITRDPSAPYVDAMGAIVEWCAARQGVRARSVAPDGRVDLRARLRSVHPLVLEDERGRAVATVAWPAVA